MGTMTTLRGGAPPAVMGGVADVGGSSGTEGTPGGAEQVGGAATGGDGGGGEAPSTAGVPASGGSGGEAPTSSSGCGQEAPTGTFQAQITAAGLERGYFVSVPETYDPSVPHRLFFGYHGSGWNGEMMRGYLDLERPPLLDRSVFIYPDGLPGNGGGSTGWELSPDGRDIAFFDALYEHLTQTYCIDEDRIFVNGQSFGAMMSNAVGCARGDVVRAIAAVAGSGPRGGECQGQVAVWLTHGEDDENVGFSSGESSRDHWAEANHCESTASPGEPEQCQNYDACDEGYPVIWCPHVGDAGHQHPSFGREAVRAFFNGF